ncbi:hypothetical protein BB559_005271 [Furculomyces boomerangus]|uniref:Uncharacterized protein n=1 Tax=Furculomyces boomerangus TaxID=61424 RepID=A0A2T9XXZ8_9FUNG|nr:hypothetical protein BB559_007304 [Furculomyces boomerangus]PVU89011.1 hypothetical protein BB559_005271 [Furculomyces boomerangus]
MINHRLSNKSKFNSKSSPKPLREFKEPATPEIYATDDESYKHGTWDFSTDTMDGSRNTIVNSNLCLNLFYPLRINTQLQATGFSRVVNSTKSAKKDKQLSETKQQVLNFARISIHVEELNRSFVQSTKPAESKKVSLLERLTAVPKISLDLPLAMLKSGETPEGSVFLRIQFKENSQKQPIASDPAAVIISVAVEAMSTEETPNTVVGITNPTTTKTADTNPTTIQIVDTDPEQQL